MNNINLKIFIYWDKGIEKLPNILKEIYNHNLRISKIYNFELVFLNDNNIKDYIDIPNIFYDLDPNFKSDIIRYICLDLYGGIWLDMDTIIINNLNILYKKLLKNNYDAILDVEYCFNKTYYNNHYKPGGIGCASIVMKKNSTCSKFCVKQIYDMIKKKTLNGKKIKWNDLGPYTIRLLYSKNKDKILLNNADITSKGCNFITWKDEPGINTNKWYLENENNSYNKAEHIFHNNCFYVMTWNIYKKNNLKNPEYNLLYDKKSVFYHLINLSKCINNLTFVIKTFNRHECIKNCILSIRKLLSNVKIIVVDDSNDKIKNDNKKIYEKYNIDYIFLKYNTGISYGRNIGICNVSTKYTMILDDDNYIIDLKYLYKSIIFLDLFNKYQIVGNIIKNREIIYNKQSVAYSAQICKIENNVINIKPNSEKIENNIIDNLYKTNIVLNSFIARTDILKMYKWDEDLKLGEHEVFFINLFKNNINISICYNWNIGEIIDDRRKYSICNKKNINIHCQYKHKYIIKGEWSLL
jgi:hypothetical protein